jgi:excisionase family DNA binding protein
MEDKNSPLDNYFDNFKNDLIASVRKEISLISQKNQTQEVDEYLTRKEVAELLKCDQSTVHNWTKKGKLTKYCIGDRTYYKKSEIEKALIPFKFNG